jgi:hypothetical protein
MPAAHDSRAGFYTAGMPALTRLALLACLLLQAAAGHAQPSAPAPAGADVRRLTAEGTEFQVRVMPITGGPAQGALVLVPGDGRHPATSRALERLRTGMPAFGWTTWTPELESPPRSHAAGMGVPASEDVVVDAGDRAQGAPPQGSDAVPGAEDPAPETPKAAADGGQEPLEAVRAGQLLAWAGRSRARLAAVVKEASAEGRVVLVAEGVGAALLTGFAAQVPNAAFATVLVDPVELPGLPAAWPRGSAVPVLEVFDHAEARAQAEARRSHANAIGLHYYRQLVLTDAAAEEPEQETPLVRRLRGWLRTLEQTGAR